MSADAPPNVATAPAARAMRDYLLPGLGLALAVFAVYAQTATFAFSSYDDTVYVSENPLINAGVTWEGLREVTLHGHHLLWTPLTSLSYMIGCNLYGLSTAGHHLSNVVLHVLAAWLVFLAVWRYTGRWWFAWFVAAVFALHPLNVESVAWVSGRKNQLYAIFWMLGLLAYRRYALSPSLARYALVFLLHFCGLASKPTHLTLPFVLLLLDVWPLNRFDVRQLRAAEGWRRMFLLGVEKLPLLLLSVAVSAWTFSTVEAAGGTRDLATVPLGMRLENTAYVYAFFVSKLFWPSGLAIHYPYPVSALDTGLLVACAALFLAFCALSVVSLFCNKSFFVGWWWYVLTLLPESGLLRANSFLMADRYAYVSVLGLVLAFGLQACLYADARPHLRRLLGGAGLMAIAGLAMAAACQAGFWKDDLHLFQRSAAVYPEGPVGRCGYGVALKVAGRIDEARTELQAALDCPGPFKVLPSMNLGMIAFETGEDALARRYFEDIVSHNPAYAPALVWLARVERRANNPAVAERLLNQAAAVDPKDKDLLVALGAKAPDVAEGLYDVGAAFARMGRPQDALPYLNRALAMNPNAEPALLALWTVQMQLGQPAAGEGTIRRYLALRESDATGWAALGISLDELGRRDEALAAVGRALALDPGQAEALQLKAKLQSGT